jgi:hypothetical protein
MPQFKFTPEQRQEFKPYHRMIDENGVVQYGQFVDVPLANVPTQYLEFVVSRAVADAITAQEELNSRSAEMLESLIESYPELQDVFVAHWEVNYPNGA